MRTKPQYKIGQRIRVNGILPWGDWKGESVATNAEVVAVEKRRLFVILDMVGGDVKCWTFIPYKMVVNDLTKEDFDMEINTIWGTLAK